jgi:hypothetical protein
MRYSLLLCGLLLQSVFASAATGDTTIIQTHTTTNLASPPSNDDYWAVFPTTLVLIKR